MKVRALGAFTACVLAASGAAQAPPRVPAPVHWSAGKPALAQGRQVSIAVLAAIDPGWHLYALAGADNNPLATEIAIAKNDPAELLRVDQGKPKRLSGDDASQVFDGAARFVLHLTPHAKGDAVHVLIRYQACDDRMCLPVRHETVMVPLR